MPNYSAFIQQDQCNVDLEPGYIIEEQFRTIQHDLSDHLTRRYDEAELDSFTYHIHITDHTHLKLIRRDSQVQSIGVLVAYVAIYDGLQDGNVNEAKGRFRRPARTA